ncbi:peptidoglycan-binding protein [Streptosporangium canum]|uniref:peptidoglycan-binding protein n=1 Tax=Streptosporangium canum TaxID=324952 RepID=UPI003677FEA4
MKRSYRNLLLVVLAGVIVIAGAGWVLASRLKSPADEAAARKPPKPSNITVAVEKRELVSVITANASIEFGSPVPVSLAGIVGDNGMTSAGTSESVGGSQRVTRAPKVGKIIEGGVLLEVNGRPVFVLQGIVPMHRSLLPGMEGDDIKQLQKALSRLGAKTPATGVFDGATAAAVKAFYKKRGYTAQEPNRQAKSELQTLKAAVGTARLAVIEQTKELNTSATIRLAKLKVKDATVELKRIKQELAVARSSELTPDEETALEAAGKAVRDASDALAKAHEELEAARLQTTQQPTSEPSALPAASATQPPQNLASLERTVVRAQEEMDAAQRTYERAEKKIWAERDKLVAEKDKAVRTAQTALLEAKEALRKEKDQTVGKIELDNAKASLAAAREMLADFLKSYGGSVPPGEVVFLSKLPARVSKAEVKAGEAADKNVALVTSSQVVAYGFVEATEANLLKKGLTATIETGLGKQVEAVLTEFGEKATLPGSEKDQQGEQGADDGNQQEVSTVPILVTPSSLASLRRYTRDSVTVKIHVGATDGPALIVPIASVVTGADGKARIQIQASNGTTREVDIKTGLSADGLVEITGDGVKEGDMVVVPSA